MACRADEAGPEKSGGAPQLHHTDRGVQYASGDYRRRLALAGITPSMSRRGNCYDNATMESFWSSLKSELFGAYVPATKGEARRMIFEYIELYYTGGGNTRRSAIKAPWTSRPTSDPRKTTTCPRLSTKPGQPQSRHSPAGRSRTRCALCRMSCGAVQ